MPAMERPVLIAFDPRVASTRSTPGRWRYDKYRKESRKAAEEGQRLPGKALAELKSVLKRVRDRRKGESSQLDALRNRIDSCPRVLLGERAKLDEIAGIFISR